MGGLLSLVGIGSAASCLPSIGGCAATQVWEHCLAFLNDNKCSQGCVQENVNLSKTVREILQLRDTVIAIE